MMPFSGRDMSRLSLDPLTWFSLSSFFCRENAILDVTTTTRIACFYLGLQHAATYAAHLRRRYCGDARTTSNAAILACLSLKRIAAFSSVATYLQYIVRS